MIDPALEELLEGDPADEVPVLMRLAPGGEPPPGVRVVTRFDRVVTCRVRRGDVLRVRAATPVASLKAARLVRAEPAPYDGGDDDLPGDVRRPPGLDATGRGTVVAVVDWGCDFAHPDFRNADGSTRLLALWDQRGRGPGSPAPYGYGRVHTRADIDRALRSRDPYRALGYHPASGPGDRGGTHGTHVMSIAAGNGGGGGPEGVAPEADLVFVHLTSGDTGGLAHLGDSVTILEAVHFASAVAGERPMVVNASVGRHGGPHDGTTLVEQGLNELAARPGRCIVQSCGNYYDRAIHASGRLLPGESDVLRWTVDAADVTPNELEVWYAGHDRMTFELTLPGVVDTVRLELGQSAPLVAGGREVGHAYHRPDDPNNGNHHLDVFLDQGGPAGTWQVRITGTDVADGRYHAWVERDAACRGCQSSFDPEQGDPLSTTGTICHGLRTIAVGAYDAHDPERPVAAFSSSGPTLDGRRKPELVAPGVRVLAARSAGPGEPPGAAYVRRSGTSMAAPHVAGTVACMYEAAARPLPVADVRAALARTARRPVPAGEPHRAGAGYLDTAAAVDAVRPRHDESLESAMMPCVPAPEPDPTGEGGPHPLVIRPLRRPVVGHAQQCLNRWMAGHATPHACGDPAFVASAMATLRTRAQLPLVVDCVYGSSSELAVQAFQRCRGVKPDGKIGKVTWPLLDAVCAASPPGPPVPPVPPVPVPPVPPVDDGSARWRGLLGPAMSGGNDVVELIDGPATFAAMAAEIARATDPERHFVYLLGWWLELDVRMDAVACPAGPGPGTMRALLTAADTRGIPIRAMLWHQSMGSHDNAAEVAFIDGLRNGAAILDPHQSGRIGSHHQKLLVVNGSDGLVAFCGGVDVACNRVCVQADCPPGGSGSGGSGGSGGPTGAPQHDVHCRIAGPAAWDLLEVFRKRWRANPAHTTHPALSGIGRPAPRGGAFVRIGETFNGTSAHPGPAPTVYHDRSVRDIALTAIRSARRFLYIEDQYLVSMEAADAIRRALVNLDHVTILIPASQITRDYEWHGFGSQVWCRRRRVIDHIRTSPYAARLRVFRLCDPAATGDARWVRHTYVHAKMLVADDELAIIGSANLNRRGWEHDSEVVAAVAGPGRDGVPLAKTLRERLWAEHLGVPRSAVTDAVASKGLWLTSPARRVCPYDPAERSDTCIDYIWDGVMDPPFPVPAAGGGAPLVARGGAPRLPIRLPVARRTAGSRR